MIKVFNINGSAVIGKERCDSNGKITLIKPRLLIIARQDNIPVITFGELLGSPDELTISNKNILWEYQPTDKKMMEDYVRVTTGLIIPEHPLKLLN